MATYIPNMTDVFPGSSEYNPDWNRIERMLRMRQNMYNEGARRLRNLYDSVFSSPMLRPSDIKRRDDYLKTITDSLNQISAMDLSVPGNQYLADNLFQPVLEDPNIAHDLAYTKKVSNELAKGQSLASSSDKKNRNQRWDIGDKYIQYKAEEYQNADDQTALGMQAPSYIPKIDYQKMAEERFTKLGISVKEDTKSGGYIWTKKNGDLVYPIAQSYVNAIMGDDPGIADMFKAQAYVERKEFAKSNAMKYGSEEQAEKFYLDNVIKNAGKTLNNQIATDNQTVAQLKKKVEAWNKLITTKGIIPNSKEHMQYLADLDRLEMAKQSVDNTKNAGYDPKSLDYNNIEDLRLQADALVAATNYTLASNQIASYLSAIKAESTLKADPYSLAEYRANLTLSVQKEMEKIRQINRLLKLKAEVAAGKYSKGGANTAGMTQDQIQATIDSALNELETISPTD